MRVAAPAVLLDLDLEHVEALLSHAAHDRPATSSSLYAFFFPPHEEEGIVRRILGEAIEERGAAATADATALSAMRAQSSFARATGPAL
jgi:hypothetical protein